MSYAAATALAVRVIALVAVFMAPILVAADVDSVGRTVAVLVLFSLAPGAAILAPLRLDSVAAELGLVIGISLGVTIIAGQVMVTAAAWSPDTATYALSLACLPCLVWGVARIRGDAE